MNRFLVCSFPFFFLPNFRLFSPIRSPFPLRLLLSVFGLFTWCFFSYSADPTMRRCMTIQEVFPSSSLSVSLSLFLSSSFFFRFSLSLCVHWKTRRVKTSFSVAALKRLFYIKLTSQFSLSWISMATNDKINHPSHSYTATIYMVPIKTLAQLSLVTMLIMASIIATAMANRRHRRGLSAVFGGSLL